jgi:hypothetical protein
MDPVSFDFPAGGYLWSGLGGLGGDGYGLFGSLGRLEVAAR